MANTVVRRQAAWGPADLTVTQQAPSPAAWMRDGVELVEIEDDARLSAAHLERAGRARLCGPLVGTGRRVGWPEQHPVIHSGKALDRRAAAGNEQ